jgi:hypothetical protein
MADISSTFCGSKWANFPAFGLARRGAAFRVALAACSSARKPVRLLSAWSEA